MTSIVAYHGDTSVKEFYVNRVKQHFDFDEIVKGHYWENGKGCAVGCLIHSGEHGEFPRLLGWPEWLARLIDVLFENLPNGYAKSFPQQVVNAISVGANLEPVKWHFCSFIMQENLDRLETLPINEALKTQIRNAVCECKAMHDSAIVTDCWDEPAWSAAESAAWSAAESAAWSEAESAAWSARSAAWSARSSAESAAWSAWSAAWSAWSAEWSAAESVRSAAESAESAESAAHIKYADKLLELLKEATPVSH